MKRKISTFLFGLLFLIGFGILIYPTVSNQWNTYRQNQLISSYDNTIQDMESEDFTSSGRKQKLSMIPFSRTTSTEMYLVKMKMTSKTPNTGRS